MADTKDDAAEKARELAESALGEYAKGHGRQGDKLAEKAVAIDRHAVEELVADLDEDAAMTGAAGGKSVDAKVEKLGEQEKTPG